MRRFDGNHKVVYMVGGLPDITQMHRDPDTPAAPFQNMNMRKSFSLLIKTPTKSPIEL